MDIISFFRSIDGVAYYLILVVNTILIFAIIGYLGEKSNEKYIEMSAKMPTTPNLNGTIDLNPITQEKHSDATIPTIAPTMVDNMITNNIVNNANVASNMEPNMSAVNINNTQNQFINNNLNNQSAPKVIRPEDNEIDPNEKAPAVLVINSNNTNMPK